MNLTEFLAHVKDVTDYADTVWFRVNNHGNGGVRFQTADTDAAHAIELRAVRAGLRFKQTETDGVLVLNVNGFDHATD